MKFGLLRGYELRVLVWSTRVKEIADALKQEIECYESEGDADRIGQMLLEHYESWLGETMLAESRHVQDGACGTPPDGASH